MENFDEFMESLLQEKGIEVEGEVREQLKDDMIQDLMNHIDRAALNELTEEQANELSEKLDDPNFGEEQVSEYMRSCGVDLQRVALETMIFYKAFYLGGGLNDQPVEANAQAEPAMAE